MIEVPYMDTKVVLSPSTDEHACLASIQTKSGMNLDDLGTKLSRMLSALAWSQSAGIVETFHLGSSNPDSPGLLAHGTYGKSMYASVRPPDQIYLPVDISEKAELALALYREGMNLNSAPHTFLSFAKVLNVSLKTGADHEKWIDDNIDHVTLTPEVDRVKAIRESNENVGKYIWKRRCAVAHSYTPPIADPDLYSDKNRIRDDIPLMKALAAIFIERKLGVATATSFFKESNQTSIQKPQDLLVKGQIVYGRVAYVASDTSMQ
jgi:hypothetical protein